MRGIYYAGNMTTLVVMIVMKGFINEIEYDLLNSILLALWWPVTVYTALCILFGEFLIERTKDEFLGIDFMNSATAGETLSFFGMILLMSSWVYVKFLGFNVIISLLIFLITYYS